MKILYSSVAAILLLPLASAKATELSKLSDCMKLMEQLLEQSPPSQGSWERSCVTVSAKAFKCEAHLPPKPRSKSEWTTSHLTVVAGMRTVTACWKENGLSKDTTPDLALGFNWDVYRSTGANQQFTCQMIEEPELGLASQFGLHAMAICGNGAK